MNLTISIAQPLLVAGQYFKVEYSTDGSSYTFWGNEPSNTFTVTGLSAGTLYYFRFTLIKSLSPLIACDSVIKTYQLPEENPCVTVSGVLNRSGDIYQLVLTFTLPSPYTNPCGGYRLEYGVLPNLISKSIPTFLTSPSINPMTLPATNNTYTVRIYAIDCHGRETLCDEQTVTPVAEPCTHAVITNKQLITQNGNYYLQLTVIPSSPPTQVYTLTYSQVSQLSSGVADSGTVSLNATGANPEIFKVQVNPNFNIYTKTISYAGALTDNCKWTSRFDVSYTWGD